MKKEIIVYSISDSLGGTSQRLLSAVSAQYPDLTFNNSYRFPFIDKEQELLEIKRCCLGHQYLGKWRIS